MLPSPVGGSTKNIPTKEPTSSNQVICHCAPVGKPARLPCCQYRGIGYAPRGPVAEQGGDAKDLGIAPLPVGYESDRSDGSNQKAYGIDPFERGTVGYDEPIIVRFIDLFVAMMPGDNDRLWAMYG